MAGGGTTRVYGAPSKTERGGEGEADGWARRGKKTLGCDSYAVGGKPLLAWRMG